MKDHQAEYKEMLEKPLDEIKEDAFFRVDSLEAEEWYGDLQLYLAIEVCRPKPDSVTTVQKVLKILGFQTQIQDVDGALYIVPQE